MNDIQRELLNVYCEFHRICTQNNLKFFAIGGTCIGAIRHNGFIPWDDDMDIAMPIEDYNQFLELCKTELSFPFSLIGPNNCHHFNSIYSKMQNESTTYVESFVYRHLDRWTGINIDIMPICGLPKGQIRKWFFIRIIDICNKINIRRRFPFDEAKSINWKLSWILCLPFRLFGINTLTNIQRKLLQKYPFENSEHILFPWRELPSKTGAYTYKNVFYQSDFSKGLSVPFEMTNIVVPTGYDRYLSMDFGDYMKMPPESKRMGNHNASLVDLERPFKFYVTEIKSQN